MRRDMNSRWSLHIEVLWNLARSLHKLYAGRHLVHLALFNNSVKAQNSGHYLKSRRYFVKKSHIRRCGLKLIGCFFIF